jgi:hypothetical protein
VAEARTLYMTYMEGWKDGAAARAYDSKFKEHTDPVIRETYEAAYTAGYEARGEASNAASERTGYKPSILRTAAEGGA